MQVKVQVHRSKTARSKQVSGARCANGSGPKTSPKFVKIIPDKLYERMVPGIKNPFTQNHNNYFFQD